jgi:AcrR family transcriptional regulator
MASPRRIGGPDAKNRGVLLDAAEQLMFDEGYAAVTSRRVAAKAGLKPQLVHYYFRTMDDLFLALLARQSEAGLERQAKALASDQPLRSLWEMVTDPANNVMTIEFVALANHRKTIRAEIARVAEQFRAGQVEAVARVGGRYGLPPDVLVVLMTGISQVLVHERALGMSTGHAPTLALVEEHLRRLEGDPAPWPPDQDS